MIYKHNTIKEKMESACKAGGLTFIFDTWNRANKTVEIESRNSGGMIYPCALMISTSVGNFQFMASGTHRQETVVLALFERTERDNTDMDYDIQQRMIERAGFLLTLIPECGLEVVGESVRYTPFTDRLDENVAGIMMELTIKDTTPEECKQW